MAKVLPIYKIEISFTASNSTGLSYTDVSADVRLQAGIPWTKGRGDAYQDVPTQSFTFTLDNNDATVDRPGVVAGRYTPDNVGSPFAPNVSRGRAVRVSANESSPAAYVQIAQLFIDSITPAWDDQTGRLSNVVVTCVDLSTFLSRTGVPKTTTPLRIYAASGAGGTPFDWWPLDDPVGTNSPVNLGSNATKVTYVPQGTPPPQPSITYQTDGLPYGDTGHCAEIFNASLTNPNPITGQGYSFSPGWSISCFFQLPNGLSAGAAIDLVMLASDPSFAQFAGIVIGSDGSLQYSINASPVAASGSTGPHTVDDGEWHHALLQFSSTGGGGASLWLDGVIVSLAGSLGTVAVALPIYFLAQVISQDTVRLEHVIAWPVAQIAGKIANLAGARNGWAGETSVQRIQRIAALAGYTPNVLGSAAVVDAAPWHDITSDWWTMMLAMAKTEQGVLYIDSTGAIAFRTRLSQYNQAAQITFVSDTYQETIQFAHDGTNFYNDFTGTAFGSANPQEVTNIGTDGVYDGSATLETQADTEALSYAQSQVTKTGRPLTRLPALDVDFMTQQGTFPGLLAAFWAADLIDLIVVSALPAAAPASSVSLLLQGFTVTLTDRSYDGKLNLSPGQLAAWVLQDATLGVLDSTTVLA